MNRLLKRKLNVFGQDFGLFQSRLDSSFWMTTRQSGLVDGILNARILEHLSKRAQQYFLGSTNETSSVTGINDLVINHLESFPEQATDELIRELNHDLELSKLAAIDFGAMTINQSAQGDQNVMESLRATCRRNIEHLFATESNKLFLKIEEAKQLYIRNNPETETLLERLTRKAKNSWAIVLLIILGAIIAFLAALKTNVMDLLPKSEENKSNLASLEFSLHEILFYDTEDRGFEAAIITKFRNPDGKKMDCFIHRIEWRVENDSQIYNFDINKIVSAQENGFEFDTSYISPVFLSERISASPPPWLIGKIYFRQSTEDTDRSVSFDSNSYRIHATHAKESNPRSDTAKVDTTGLVNRKFEFGGKTYFYSYKPKSIDVAFLSNGKCVKRQISGEMKGGNFVLYADSTLKDILCKDIQELVQIDYTGKHAGKYEAERSIVPVSGINVIKYKFK